MRVIRVGVAGLGTVGSEAVRLLKSRREDFVRRLRAELRVTAVCDRHAGRKARALGLSREVRRLRRPQDLLGEPLDIVIETLGGLADARGLVLGALKSGRHVVTANKRLLAHHWDEIFKASALSGSRVYFEASVAGGIPILQAIHQSLAANRIRRVLGILNGTTNFILTRMAHGGLELGPALKEAQRLGFAERDPRMDLDGTDAAHKVSVIASLLTGRWVRPRDIPHEGILGVTASDIRFAARELQRAARLLGVVELDWDQNPVRVSAYVRPTLVPVEHPLASVHGEYNAVLVESSAAGDLMFYGKGAGAGPAASAVVGDVFMLSQEILGERTPEASSALWAEGGSFAIFPLEETAAPFYLRLLVRDRPGVLSRITGALSRHGISISRIYQEEGRAAPRGGAAPWVPVFITTHPASQRSMERARREILAFPFVSRSHSRLRML